MGSFTELPLAFTFTAETPAEVLGAFAELDEHGFRPVPIWSVGREPFRFEGEFEIREPIESGRRRETMRTCAGCGRRR